ncbi:MAG: hypothetical protein V3V08_01050 [Nannocystaceae bacterium]
MRRSPARLQLHLIWVSGALACACTTAPVTPTADPEGVPPAAAALAFRLSYPTEPFKLRERLRMSLHMSGQGASRLVMNLVGTLDVRPHTGETLRVDSTVERVHKYEVEGALQPDGDTDIDLVEFLSGRRHFAIVNIRGEDDEGATSALSENVRRRGTLDRLRMEAAANGKPSAELRVESMGLGDAVLSLPQLPDERLVSGQTVKVPRKEEVRALGATEVRVAVDRTYDVQAIDSSSGQRVITIDFQIEGSGANETPAPAAKITITYEEHTKGSLSFNLDAMIPVALNVVQSTSISTGEMHFQQSLELSAQFEGI